MLQSNHDARRSFNERGSEMECGNTLIEKGDLRSPREIASAGDYLVDRLAPLTGHVDPTVDIWIGELLFESSG